MSGPEPDDLRRWMEQRFDRIDDKLERETRNLNDEIVNTRHGIKPLIEQLGLDAARHEKDILHHRDRIDAIDTWRVDGGVLDQRFHRHSQRIEAEAAWRHTVRGGLIAISIMVPLATGIVVAIVVAVLARVFHLPTTSP